MMHTSIAMVAEFHSLKFNILFECERVAKPLVVLGTVWTGQQTDFHAIGLQDPKSLEATA